MRRSIKRVLKRALWSILVIGIALLAIRAYRSLGGPALQPWHTFVPTELSTDQMDAGDWGRYLAQEDAIMASVQAEVSQKLAPDQRVPINRYFEASPVYPARFAHDWNRSYVMEPDGKPRGVVVLLHGLTDSPYSLRHIARHYRDQGYVAIGIRLPAHGTVPAGLTDVRWEDWMAATRLAVREARRRTQAPLHVVGFSNGGALAMKYALDALDDRSLARPDRLVLISPMIGITSFARFVGFAELPAMLPAFAKAAWLGIVPEFNPFKYNSFPVNGARQSHRLTAALQDRIARAARDGSLDRLAPVLTFHSVVDFTVSTRAIISALYDQLPANGSELVLFDINRSATIGPLLRSASETVLSRLLGDPPRKFRTTIITNASADRNEVVEQVTEAGATTQQIRELPLSFPPGIFSLSHVALPFPVTDALYGLTPDKSEDFGVNLGALAPRGERGVLIVNLDSLLRVSSNPFYPYLIDRIAEGIVGGSKPGPQ